MHNNKTVDLDSNILELQFGYDDSSGVYQCYAENSVGIAIGNIINVEIFQPPKLKAPYSVPYANHGISPRLNTFKLDCPYSGASTTRWEISRKENLKSSSYESSREGNYTCFVENIAGKANFTFHIFENVPPRIFSILVNGKNVTDNDEIILIENEPAVIDCVVHDALADINLYKNQYESLDDDLLNIPAVKIEDSAYYTCKVNNSEGTYERSFWLKVNGNFITIYNTFTA